MKIALVGYGKMGQIIDKIAQTRGHEIVARLNESPTLENLNNPDVVIEFSSPYQILPRTGHSRSMRNHRLA